MSGNSGEERPSLPALGVCYYPEHWPEEIWARDARRMAEAGLSYVRIGEFAWSRIEPAPGDLHLGWLVRAMDVLHAYGLKVVVGTPTASPPRWLVSRIPDMLVVDEDGRTRKFGSRRHYCFSHPGYREESARIVRIVAGAVKDHPALAAWQTDNEYGCHGSAVSYSPAAEAGFRRWLEEKYRDIDALNAAWGTAFWSMAYSDFGEVELPNLTQCEASPTHTLDFLRYSSDQIVAYNRVQVDAIRAITPDVPITHNYMAASTGFDHFRIGRDMQFASWDSYPLGQLERREGASGHKTRFWRQGDPDFQAFHHDLYRAVGKGRFWVMEQQPGPVSWAPHNADPLPGMVRLWAWEAFAHGAEAVCFFRWRQVPFAQEQMHSGLLRPDDEPAPALAEVARLSREIEALEQPIETAPADCAIVYDYESAWAWQVQPQSAGFSHFEAVFSQYRRLRELGLNVDLVPSRCGDLSAYRLVFVPALFAWSADLLRALVAHQGVVVIGPRSGSKTPCFQIPSPLPPGLPPDFIDVKVVRVASLAPDTPVPLKGGGAVRLWLDMLETNAERLLETEDGWPVHVRQGRVHYLAGLLDDDAARRMTRALAEEAGLPVHDLPDGVRVRWAGKRGFVFNYTSATQDLREAGFACPIGIDGALLPPAGVAACARPSGK